MRKWGYLITLSLIIGTVIALIFIIKGTSLSIVEDHSGVDYGVSLIRDGRYNDAASVFAEALESNPNDPELLNYLGISRFNKGDYAGALKAFSSALKINPSLADANHNLGLTYHEMGLYYHAIEYYERVINLGADDDLLHYHMGLTKIALRDWDGAVESLDTAVTLGSRKTPPDDKMLEEYRRYLKYARYRDGFGKK
ncbi:MAG: tetratricopeptide repeat protein [Deltaproteobacteria bacterium]|uniref:Tetratricopeptide repeat protein n=1 Tax=Candidatus Zymogenus saltonus TaxID=2844893 RepID=A0A9D8PPH0_9DELT|nr:tetratricopeptide repeat protein [Candidatus Zymogenus saltonus]